MGCSEQLVYSGGAWVIEPV